MHVRDLAATQLSQVHAKKKKVAEVGGQETWQRAVLGLAAAGHDKVGVRRVLERAANFIEEMHLAEVRNVDIEVVDLPHEEGLWDPDDGDADPEPS